MKNALVPTLVATAVVGMLIIPTAAQAAETEGVEPAVVSRSVQIADGDGPSSRALAHPEGGTWEYGTRGFVITDTFSDYYHPTRKHGSSAGNGNGDFESSKIVAAKAWSRSSVHHTFVGNVAFYRFS